MLNLTLLLQTSPVTLTLMPIVLIISLYGLKSNRFYLKMVHHPFSMIKNREYHRLISSGTVHNDVLHLLINEAMLLFICGNLEDALRARSESGSLEFFLIYLVSHLSGVLGTAISNKKTFEYSSAGASGSVIGCMMSFMILKPNYIGLYLPVIGGVKNIFVGLIVIVGLFVYQRRSGNDMMDNEFHFYSAIGGIAATVLLFPHLIF
jgi:membrane associated rhomboid family serine protease